MSKIVPAVMSNIKLDGSGKVISNTWSRSKGVDSYGAATRLLKGGPTSIALTSYAASNTSKTYTISDATDRANFIAAQDSVGRAYTVNGDNITVTYPAGLYVHKQQQLPVCR